MTSALKEYVRGFAGGLIFSLPLLYTMEVWWSGFLASPARLLGYLVAIFFLLLGYNRYAGMHHDSSWLDVARDSVEELGLGLITATILLWMIGQLTDLTVLSEGIGKVVVEGGVAAIGFSVGSAQLGGGGDDELEDDLGHGASTFGGQITIAFCGSVLFAANVAPTEEIVLIALESTAGRLLALLILSLVVAALVLFYIDFKSSSRYSAATTVFEVAGGAALAYTLALIASALMLWFFGRFSGISLDVAIREIVVLAFPAVLGSSAGRLLLQE